MRLSTIRKITIILIIFVIGLGIGQRYGSYQFDLKWRTYIPQISVLNREAPPAETTIDFSRFWVAWDKVNTKFVDKEKIVPSKMLDGAISGMVDSLGDPYTVYLPPKQNQETKEDLQGSFEGIGAQLGLKDKKIIVIAPLADSPAEKAGIKASDHIYKVGDEIMDGKNLPYAVDKIRGPKGTTVRLTLKRNGVKNDIIKEIKRDTIIVKSTTVDFKKVKNGEIAVIHLMKFGDRTDDEWLASVNKILEKGSLVKGIVLDLRNNPGGYLNSSVFIASEFLPSGKTIVTQRAAQEDKVYKVNREGKLLNTPLVVLINKGSASASEILAGALKDNERAKLVGEKSFGKGSVQEAEDLDAGAGLHITVAKWLLPAGAWINGKGIEPDIKVLNDEKSPNEDKQLKRAIEELTKTG